MLWQPLCDLRVVRTTALVHKSYNGGIWKTFTGLGLKGQLVPLLFPEVSLSQIAKLERTDNTNSHVTEIIYYEFMKIKQIVTSKRRIEDER